MKYLLFVFCLLFPSLSSAEQGIIQKNGACPSGYHTSGNYCVANNNHYTAIEKSGTCPMGYFSSGNYCVSRYGVKIPNPAIAKNGACPGGYHTSGNYCLKNGE